MGSRIAQIFLDIEYDFSNLINKLKRNLEEVLVIEYDDEAFVGEFVYNNYEMELYGKYEGSNVVMLSKVCYIELYLEWTDSTQFEHIEYDLLVILKELELKWTTIEWGVSNSEEKTYRVLYPSGEVKYESL